MTKNICFLLSLVLHLVLFVLVGGQSSDGCFCVERLGKSPLTDPVVLQKAGDGTDRLFVGELPGLIHVYYPNGEILPEPFIDVRPWMGQFPVTLDGHTHMIEFGLFGMALHPDFSENGLFYLHFTRENDEPGTDYLYKMRIGEFKVSTEDKNKADPSYFRLILDVRQSEMNHDGGQILFGDDGYLYIFLGDGGDMLDTPQDMEVLLGKVLRIDVDNPTNGAPYGIPPDNPFLRPLPDATNARPEIFAYGFKCPWRCGKDPGDPYTGNGHLGNFNFTYLNITKPRKPFKIWNIQAGINFYDAFQPGKRLALIKGYGKGRIICGDVGQRRMEELDLIEKGANYGWNNKEGTARYCYKCRQGIRSNPPTEPIFAYQRNQSNRAVIGGVFYRGCGLKDMAGAFVYGNFGDGKIFRLLETETGKWANEEIEICGPEICLGNLSSTYANWILSFGLDDNGEIYILSTNDPAVGAPEGSIYRLVDPSNTAEDIDRCRSSQQAARNRLMVDTNSDIRPFNQSAEKEDKIKQNLKILDILDANKEIKDSNSGDKVQKKPKVKESTDDSNDNGKIAGADDKDKTSVTETTSERADPKSSASIQISILSADLQSDAGNADRETDDNDAGNDDEETDDNDSNTVDKVVDLLREFVYRLGEQFFTKWLSFGSEPDSVVDIGDPQANTSNAFGAIDDDSEADNSG